MSSDVVLDNKQSGIAVEGQSFKKIWQRRSIVYLTAAAGASIIGIGILAVGSAYLAVPLITSLGISLIAQNCLSVAAGIGLGLGLCVGMVAILNASEFKIEKNAKKKI